MTLDGIVLPVRRVAARGEHARGEQSAVALVTSNEIDIVVKILDAHREVLDSDAQIIEQRGRGLDAALRCGRLLRERKNPLKHGGWLPWLQEHCSEITERSAQRYLFITKHWDLLQRSWRPDAHVPGQMNMIEGGGTYNYGVVDAERAIRDLLQRARIARNRSATVADFTDDGRDPLDLEDWELEPEQPDLVEPTRPAAHTDLIADQKLMMVAATIRDYDRQTAIVKRVELLDLRAAIDEALRRTE